jgi:hypothetical protein
MALTIQHNHKDYYIDIIVDERFTIHEYYMAMNSILSNENIPNKINALWDFTAIELDEHILDLFEKISKNQKQFVSSRGVNKSVAIVLQNLDNEIAQKVSTQVEPHTAKETRFFKNKKDAIHWLKEKSEADASD